MVPSPQKRAVLEQQEPKQTSPAPGLGTCWDGHRTPIRLPDLAWSAASAGASRGRLYPVHMLCWVQADSIPHKRPLSSTLAPLGAAPGQEGLEQAPGVGWSKRWGSCGNRPEPWAGLVGFLCLSQGVNTCAHTLLEGSLNFLQSSCEAHWFSNPDKGAPPSWFWTLEVGCPMYGSNLLLPRADLWVADVPLLLCPLLGAQVPTWLRLRPSSATLCDLSLQAWA